MDLVTQGPMTAGSTQEPAVPDARPYLRSAKSNRADRMRPA